MSEILKCLEIDILVMSKSSELYLKYKEVESYARYLKNHEDMFQKFLRRQNKAKFLTDLYNKSFPQKNNLNSITNFYDEKRRFLDNQSKEVNNLIEKFKIECENFFYEDAKNRYLIIDNILLSYQEEYEKTFNDFSGSSSDNDFMFRKNQFNYIIEQGHNFLKESFVFLNFMTMKLKSCFNTCQPLMTAIINSINNLNQNLFEFIYDNDKHCQEVQIEFLKKKRESLCELDEPQKSKLDETQDLSQQDNLKEHQGITSLNQISTIKKLKVKIPSLKKNSSFNEVSSSNKEQQEFNSGENLSKKNSFSSNIDQCEVANIGNMPNTSNEIFTKFPLVIDETVKDTREFIKFLQELNKKDLSTHDKKRMENYLSKSISEVQKKISDDIQKMN